MMMRTTLCVAVAIVLGTGFARAQSAEDERGYVSVNGGLKMTPSTFSSTVHPIAFVEAGTVDTRFEVKSAPQFDFGGGVGRWRDPSVGPGPSPVSKKGGPGGPGPGAP